MSTTVTDDWFAIKVKQVHPSGAYAILEWRESKRQWEWDVYNVDSFQVATGAQPTQLEARGAASGALRLHVDGIAARLQGTK